MLSQDNFMQIIRDQTRRALWETRNVIACISDALWEKPYCEAPLWQHVYHMLHSLDLWYCNPRDTKYTEPAFQIKDLNNLDIRPRKTLSRQQLDGYCDAVFQKIEAYTEALTDAELLGKPENCEYTRFTLILAQFRHLHSHMGMLMGFIIAETGEWPYVLGLERPIPDEGFGVFCE